MPKQKTHRGLKKRIKVSAGGKVRLGRAGKSHLMTGTRGKNIRKLRGRGPAVSDANQKRLGKMLTQG